MSVTSLLKLPDVRAALDRVAPAAAHRIDTPLLAPPATRSYGLVGTAFDYACRFELQRLFPHARTKPWVAEAGLRLLPRLSKDPAVIGEAERIVREARAALSTYLVSKRPTDVRRRAMAEHALRLAKLDSIFRSKYVDPRMGTAEPENVQDVLRLIEIMPAKVLGHPQTVWLNPTFGDWSLVVGGADCDIVSGDRLLDIKVTKSDTIERDYVRQLISYAMLSRLARRSLPTWPGVRHLGIYFARHAFLWTMPAGEVFDHPHYAEVEAWYLDRARTEFGNPAARTGKSAPIGPSRWGLPDGMTHADLGLDEPGVRSYATKARRSSSSRSKGKKGRKT